MSTIFFKFPHQSTESRLTFDGTHISVFDVKKEVMLQTKLGSGRDFDLSVTDASSKEVLTDDHHQIPRSTSVIIRRIAPNPKLKNGGTAARYIAGTSASVGGRDDLVDRRVEASSREELMNKRGLGGLSRGGGMMGKGNMTARFDKKEEEDGSAAPAPPATEEEARLAAFFNETSNEWEQTHEALSHQTRVHGSARGSFRPRGGGPGHAAPPANWSGQGPPPGMSSSNWHYLQNPDKEPPPGYICFRCGQKGHWIQACPTNENPEFEGKPRFKRTTGIPKSFLKTVEKPADGADSDDPNLGGASVMITGDGSFVTVQPDRQTWRKTTKPKPLTAGELLNLTSDGSSGGGGLALPPHLTCPVCTRLLHTPSRTPCCKSLYCEECIHNHLLDNDFVCPSCESKISSLKGVKVDEEVKKQVDEFVDVEVERRKQERKAAGDDGEGEGSEDEVKAEVKGEEADENKSAKAKSEEPGVKPGTPNPEIKDEVKLEEKPAEGATGTQDQSAQMAGFNNNNNGMNNNGNNMDPAMMMNMMNMMGMMGGMNPMMALQAQAAQIMMNLQNPQLLHPVRLQLQVQLNMIQQQMSQMSMMGMGMGMGMPMNGMNMNMNGMMGSPMGQLNQGQQGFNQQQQQQRQQMPHMQQQQIQQQQIQQTGGPAGVKRKSEGQGGPAAKQARQ